MTNASEMLADISAGLGLGCWVACFIWMHRISTRQDGLLKELHAVARRIEGIAAAEHELIQEVHPQVTEIKETVEGVAKTVESR